MAVPDYVLREEARPAVVERMVHAVLAARPLYMTALLFVEGRAMPQAGGGARGGQAESARSP